MEQPDYKGPERRALKLEDIAVAVDEALDERLPTTESILIAHINAKNAELAAAITTLSIKVDSALQAARLDTERQIKALRDEAFPDGPLYRHKDFHDGRIKQAEKEDRIKADLLSWAIKGGLGLVGAMVLLGFIEWLKREITK